MARTKGAKAIPKNQRAALVAIEEVQGGGAKLAAHKAGYKSKLTAKKYTATATARKAQKGPDFNIYEDPDNFNNIKQPPKPELLPDKSKQRLFEHATKDKENAE
ncbi:hypothetical protein K469DRAFT_788572 [Zopfia rhizophila CBS 207.26]|uniref:Uncharacterized protein n=1 Tax=Zopfia rhizophila CBS 207.26 TaxID=1314779 RepID=A0A6A6DVQ2_9PEZI|nr:hypothetical protein K469DRAFT_788572 [Zopfia rhizophila CBS 207.26]